MAAEKAYSDAAEAATGGLPQFDLSSWNSQIFWLVVTFGTLYFVLARFVLPRIGGTISERSDRIADDLDAASRAQKEAELAAKAYERVMADAKAKAHNIAETTRKSVDDEIGAEVASAEEEFARRQASADERIANVRSEALSHLDAIAIDTAKAIAEKIGDIKPTAVQVKSAIKAASQT